MDDELDVDARENVPAQPGAARERTADTRLSDAGRGAGVRQDPIGRDLDVQYAAYGRDGGAQDRFQDGGGDFGRAGSEATWGQGDGSPQRRPVEESPASATGEPLQGNSETERCRDCGRLLAPQAGYRLYADGSVVVLCADCYQQRLATDGGGRTHDLIAQVDGGSG